MSASWSLVQFLRNPDMRAAVQTEIDAAYEDDTCSVRSDVEDVIADALAAARNELRDRAMGLADCNKAEDCKVRAAFLVAFAGWLESQP